MADVLGHANGNTEAVTANPLEESGCRGDS